MKKLFLCLSVFALSCGDGDSSSTNNENNQNNANNDNNQNNANNGNNINNANNANNANNLNNANNVNNANNSNNLNNNMADMGMDSGSTDMGSDMMVNVSTTLSLDFTATIGGSQTERIQGVYVDDQGNVFVAGTTGSGNFPTTPGAYDRQRDGVNNGGLDNTDGFVAKFDSNGQLQWSTLLGGSRRDSAYSVRTDSAGNVYVIGSTGSQDFPTTAGAFDRTLGGSPTGSRLFDAFIVSLSADGSTLRWGTYIGGGGTGEENPRGAIRIDEARNRIYFAGMTKSTGFPTTANAFQPNFGGGVSDGFVGALSIDGSTMIAASYIGGQGGDMAFSMIELAPDGSVYVAGGTNSSDFPTTAGAFQEQRQSGNNGDEFYQSGDGFVARLSADLSTIIWATYLGGSGVDAVNHNQGLTVDPQGRVVVVGTTESNDFPTTPGAFSTTNAGGVDLFATVFNIDGSLAHSSYVGTSGDDYVSGVHANDHGVFLSGIMSGAGLPVSADAEQSNWNPGANDAFLFGFTPDLAGMYYSTYLGGTSTQGGERGRTVWTTDTEVVVGGATDSADIPGAIGQFGGGVEGFISRFEIVPR